MVNARTLFIAVSAALLATTSFARADVEAITNDTYIDSYDGSSVALQKNTDVNYGNTGATKVVVSAGSDANPLFTSTCRSLFTLPAAFWGNLASANNPQVYVSIRIRNYNNNSAQPALFTRSVALYPLITPFTAGNGGLPSQTKNGGTENNVAPNGPVGADWFTSNGTTAWTTAGGDFDSANSVSVNYASGLLPTPTSLLASTQTSSDSYITWNITSLLNNPTAKAEIQANGLMLKITDDTNYPDLNTQQFLSFYSAEGAGTDTASQPIVFFTPEPASLSLLAFAAFPLLTRRKQKDA